MCERVGASALYHSLAKCAGVGDDARGLHVQMAMYCARWSACSRCKPSGHLRLNRAGVAARKVGLLTRLGEGHDIAPPLAKRLRGTTLRLGKSQQEYMLVDDRANAVSFVSNMIRSCPELAWPARGQTCRSAWMIS